MTLDREISQAKTIRQINKYFVDKTIRIEAGNTQRKLANYKKKLKSGRVGVKNKLSKETNIDVVEQLDGYFSKAVATPIAKIALLRVLKDLFTLKGDRQQRLTNFGKGIFVQAVEGRVYGHNKKSTIKRKGFDKKYYATGQLEKSIKTFIKKR